MASEGVIASAQSAAVGGAGALITKGVVGGAGAAVGYVAGKKSSDEWRCKNC